MIALNTVIPVFVLIAVGFIATRSLRLDARPFARLGVYVLGPAVILNAVLTAQLRAAEVGGIVAFGVVWMAAMLLISSLAGRAVGFDRRGQCGLLLNTAFSNAVNYGLPVVFFAFGSAGFERAAVFGVFNSIAMATAGLYLAILGGRDPAAPRAAARGGELVQTLAQALRMPMIPTIVVGVLIRVFDVPLPEAVQRPITLLGTGALPLFLLILGMQVATISRPDRPVRPLRLALGTVLRLVVGPLVALAVVPVIGLTDLTARVMVLQAAMPAAVNTTLLAIEFDAEPEAVAATTLVTTGLSLVTVALLVAWAG